MDNKELIQPIHIKVTETLYNEIEYYNLPSSMNGHSAESYSKDKEEQEAYNRFDAAWQQAKRSGNYRVIELSDREQIKVAVHCIDNVKHFAGSASSEPRPMLSNHCTNILSEIYKLTGIKYIL